MAGRDSGGLRTIGRASDRVRAHAQDAAFPPPLGDGLFELRPRGPEGIGRAVYCYLVGQRVVVLHAFVKKTQATPERDLKLARRRMKEVRHG